MKTKKLSPLTADKAERDSRQNRCLYSDPAGFFLTGFGFRLFIAGFRVGELHPSVIMPADYYITTLLYLFRLFD